MGHWIDWDEVTFRNLVPKMSKYYPPNKTRAKIFFGYFPILTLVICVIIATMAILTIRLILQKSSISLLGGILGGIINAVTIVALNLLYSKLALILTDWGTLTPFSSLSFSLENHRTQSEWEKNLIVKLFLFQFVNSYTSLYYIAFFKNGVSLWGNSDLQDYCRYGNPSNQAWGCTNELTIQVAILVGVNIAIGQAQVPKR